MFGRVKPTLEGDRYSTYRNIALLPIRWLLTSKAFSIGFASDRSVPAFQDSVSKLDTKFTLQVAISPRHNSVSWVMCTLTSDQVT